MRVSVEREKVRFPSGGQECAAELYRQAGIADPSLPERGSARPAVGGDGIPRLTATFTREDTSSQDGCPPAPPPRR